MFIISAEVSRMVTHLTDFLEMRRHDLRSFTATRSRDIFQMAISSFIFNIETSGLKRWKA